jgi:5-oxoprolinase (ATP-hydrolysing)
MWPEYLGSPNSKNIWKLGRKIYQFGAKNSAQMQAGERIIVRTPGGGWGLLSNKSQVLWQEDARHAWRDGSIANRMATQEASM